MGIEDGKFKEYLTLVFRHKLRCFNFPAMGKQSFDLSMQNAGLDEWNSKTNRIFQILLIILIKNLSKIYSKDKIPG